MTIGTRRRLCPRLGMLVGQIALLVSFADFLCVASSSPRPRQSAEDQSAAKAEIPFQNYNDNLIIVKATIGSVKNVNMILDTGTSPSAISKEMGDRLKLRGKTESLQTLNGTIQTQSLILPSIQIGPLAASPIKVVGLCFAAMRFRCPVSPEHFRLSSRTTNWATARQE
jgi:Aspartyl protease